MMTGNDKKYLKKKKTKETYYNAMCPAVVATSDCPKTFLSSSVPLQVQERKHNMKDNSKTVDERC